MLLQKSPEECTKTNAFGSDWGRIKIIIVTSGNINNYNIIYINFKGA